MADRSIPLEQFQIQSPCTADWGAMQGDDAKRFCDKCQKHVHDLSRYDRAEADALLAAPVAGHACVRMARDGEGRVITRDYWKLAAGAALAATVGLSGCDRVGTALERTLEAVGISTRKGGVRPAATTGMACPPPIPSAPAPMGEACPDPAPSRVLMGDVAMPQPSIESQPDQPPPKPVAPPLTGAPVPVPPPSPPSPTK